MTVLNLDLQTEFSVGVMHPDLILNDNTWIISDTHFGHANIIKYCGRPYNHNQLMVDAWEQMIRPNDYVLHLGDVSIWHRSHVQWAQRTKNLPGKKFLILGNHDGQWTEIQWRTVAGFTVTPPFIWTPDNWQASILFTHEASAPAGTWEFNVHGHSHTHAPFGRYERLQATYYNLAVEGTSYKPIRLGEILNELRS